MEMFSNRKAVLLTKHKKEEVIFPVLKETGMLLNVESGFDTDLLGTFTGEIVRDGTQLETARAKALKAIEITGHPIGIASEGSFGSHPAVFFAQADCELVLMIDAENDLEIAGWELSTKTNNSEAKISHFDEAVKFAEECGFPQQGIVVKYQAANEKIEILAKGITSYKALQTAIDKALKLSFDGQAHVETDMRAMYNPMRMKVIEKAAINLFDKMKSLCSECNWPGFEITERIKGLPCQQCSMPTKGVLKHLYQCKKCNFAKEIKYPGGKKYTDPMYCDFCNP